MLEYHSSRKKSTPLNRPHLPEIQSETHEGYHLPILEHYAKADVRDFADAGAGINAFWWSDLTNLTGRHIS
jgi:hypothetical protein